MTSKEDVEVYLGDLLKILDSIDDADIVGLNSVTLSVVLDECAEVMDEVKDFVNKLYRVCGDECRGLIDEVHRLLREIKEESKNVVDFLSRIPYGQSIVIYIIDNLEKRWPRFNQLLGKEGIRRLLKDLSAELENIEDILEEIEEEDEFNGRKGVRRESEITSSIDDVSSLLQNIKKCYKELREIHYDIRRIIKSKNSSNIRELFSIKDLQGKYQVARQLSLRASGNSRLYANTMLNILTGLSSITARPAYEQIELSLGFLSGDEEPAYLSMDELFFRYPPFEPISARLPVKIEGMRIRIAGSYTWLINCNELTPKSKKRLGFSQGLIYKGTTEERDSRVFLSSVKPINVLSFKDGEIYLEFYNKKSLYKKVFLKYGSRRLRETIKECLEEGYKDREKIEECIRKKYLNFLGSKRKYSDKSSYDPLDLSYVWFCALGKGLSTDPWDTKCPFENVCEYASSAKLKAGEKCPYWSWSRRIFPKVFPQIDVEVHVEGHEDKGSIGLFSVFTARHAYVVEKYIGVQWKMPAYMVEGIPLYLTFKQPLVKELPDTNVIGLEFPLDFILQYSKALLEGSIDTPYVKLGYNRKISLVDLLVTKFFLWRRTRRGVLSFEYLRKKKADDILEDYKNFRIKLMNDKHLKEEFGLFIAKVLAHTLAHLLVSYLASSLDLRLEDFIYYYRINKRNNTIEVYAVENSPFGNLDLPGQIEEQFGNVSNMFWKFIGSLLSMLEDHSKEVERSLIVREKLRREFLSKNNSSNMDNFLNMLKELYGKFSNEGLAFDQWYFSLHLLFSGEYRKYASKARLDYRGALQYFDDIVPLVGPPLCLDGCNNCVMFERGCRETLGQPLSISRHLVEFFLGSLYGGQEFRAIGGIFGPLLLGSVTKRKLFVVSPFINEEGIKFLEELASKNVEVILVTRKNTLRKIPSNVEFRVAAQFSPSHEKMYIIDDELVITSSWNLTIGSKSMETFLLSWNNKKASELEEKYLRESMWIH